MKFIPLELQGAYPRYGIHTSVFAVHDLIQRPQLHNIRCTKNTMCFCWLSMWWWTGWTQQCLFAVLLTVLPFCLCLSLRPHPHCGECDRGDAGGGRLGDGGVWTWCPSLQATRNEAAVNLWEREESVTWKVLGDYCPKCLLEGAGWCPLQEGRGDSTSNGEAILAKRYAHFLATWNWTSVLRYSHSNDAHQYSLAYLCGNCILHTWILYLSVHVPIVTHDHNHIMVAMQETWFTTTHL